MLIFEKQQYIFESPSDFKVVIKSRKDNNGNDLSLYPMKYTFFDSYNSKYECWYNSEDDKKNCVYNGDSIELIFEKYKLLGRISYIEYFSVDDSDFSDGTRDTYCTYVSPFYIKSLYGGNCGQCDNNEIIAAAKVDVTISTDVVCDDTLSLTSENPVQNKVITQALNDKVDKEDGKVLSDNNFTDDDKTKLDGLENYDDSAIVASLANKVDKIAGKELSSNDFTDDEKNKLAGLENTIVDSSLSTTSTNPVQNKLVTLELNNKQDNIAISNETSATKEIEPNKYYKWGEMASLTITIAEPTNTSILNEYMFEFTSGATATTLTLPANIKGDISIESNTTYQCSIVNNYIVIGGFANE